MKFLIKGPNGEVVAKRVVTECATCFASLPRGGTTKCRCPAFGKVRRFGVVMSTAGTTCLCSPAENDVNSVRVFRARLEAYTTVTPFVQGIRADLLASYNQQLNRVTHNLTSLNAHCIQELFALVPQETLTKNIWQQMNVVKEAMRASPDEAAKTFLRIAKNNLAMKLEFVAMRYVDEAAPHPAFREHPIQKVVLNVLHAFFQDFNDHGVHVKVEDCDAYVSLDYDTFHVALYHIMDNATKYVMPKSTVTVRFALESGRVHVLFEMMSLAIAKQEVHRIGEEWFSGDMAKHLQLAGHGMGMFRTKRLLRANNGYLSVRCNIDPAKATRHNGIEYEQNEFLVSVTASQQRRTMPSSVPVTRGTPPARAGAAPKSPVR